MATILDTLKNVSGYPLPIEAIESICLKRDIASIGESSAEILNSRTYRLAVADCYKWLSLAPNVNQADVSYSFAASDRDRFLQFANSIYRELKDDAYIQKVKTRYGYKGSRL
jgi:hypothetical protein